MALPDVGLIVKVNSALKIVSNKFTVLRGLMVTHPRNEPRSLNSPVTLTLWCNNVPGDRDDAMQNLFDIHLHDGSRQFARLPANSEWNDVREHVKKLPGAELVGLVCDRITEVWMDFTYKNQTFTINDQFCEYWFFIHNPCCQEEILCEVKAHWETLLGEGCVAWLDNPAREHKY